MSDRPKTRICIILDKSGSMAPTKSQTISGLNEQIQEAKKRAKEQDLRVSLVSFDGEVYEHLWDAPVEQLIEASPEDYIPNGGTNWNDAVGYCIQKLLDTATPEDKDTAYLVYVISDGEANIFTGRYTSSLLSELVQGTEATGKWTYTLMGPNQEYLKSLARRNGIPISNTARWDNTSGKLVDNAFQHQNVRLNKFLDERAMGKTQSASYNSPCFGGVSAAWDGGAVADYSNEALTLTSADCVPDMGEVKLGKEVDMGSLLSQLPQYSNTTPVVNLSSQEKGIGLFAQTVGVQFTPVVIQSK